MVKVELSDLKDGQIVVWAKSQVVVTVRKDEILINRPSPGPTQVIKL